MSAFGVHELVRRNSIETFQRSIASISSHEKEQLILSRDENGCTPLHLCQSSEMVELLLSNVSADIRQSCIRTRSKAGQTAAHEILTGSYKDAFSAMWDYTDDQTRTDLIMCGDNWGQNLLMLSGFGDCEDAASLLIEHLQTMANDLIVKVVATKNCRGNTALHSLVINQFIEEVAEILKPLTVANRRSVLGMTNKRNFCCFKLLRISNRMQESDGTYMRIFFNANAYRRRLTSNSNGRLTSLIKLLVNDYTILPMISIVSYEVNSLTLTHYQHDSDNNPIDVEVSHQLCLKQI